jgi:uncharacterized membrane protein (TIGR02234 family)
LTATGRQAQPVLPALGLIGGAAGVVLAICGPVVRWFAAAALLLAGAGAAASAVVRVSDLAGLLQPQAARVSGVAGTAVQGGQLSAWPWLAVAAGGLIALAGIIAAVSGPAWSGADRRYRRPGETATVPEPSPADQRSEQQPVVADPLDTWDALSRGEDPTATGGG